MPMVGPRAFDDEAPSQWGRQNPPRVRKARTRAQTRAQDLAEQPPIIMKQPKARGKYDASMRLGQLAHIPSLVMGGERQGPEDRE
jgi:hypothetical protein